MRIFLVSLFALVGTTLPGQTQGNGLQTVLAACKTSGAECQQATSDYLQGLSQAGLSGVDYNDRLTDLVVALAESAQDDERCDERDEFAAQSIAAAARFSSGPEQQRQVEDIAEAVGACVPQLATAVIPNETPSASAN